MLRRPLLVPALLPLFLLAACGRAGTGGNSAPPQVTTPADLPGETSTIVVPVAASLDQLQRTLDAELPRRLWRIDQRVERCVPAQRVDLGIAKVKVLGDLGCRVVGQVVRGPVRLSGSGDRLRITMPVRATITAQKVGGLVSKTATGAAQVHAVARLSMNGDWQPAAKVDIDYDWTEAPGMDFLGQRITFVDKADERLKPVVAQLERTLPRELARLRLRNQLAQVWAKAFTSINLNRDRPPAWMRVTPQRLGFGGYRIDGRTLTATLFAEALTQTYVGDRPADPSPIPLPPPAARIGSQGLRFFIPVVADYRQLEPVVLRALRKLDAKGIVLPQIGRVDARFDRVTVYATTADHLAIGVKVAARARDNPVLAASGTVWLTAIPYNEPDTQRVQARDVAIAADTDSRIANLLVALFTDADVRGSIQAGLTHDFVGDYNKVLRAARRALDDRRQGDFLLDADITRVRNGALAVTGEGLFMPVRAEGIATIRYRPR